MRTQSVCSWVGCFICSQTYVKSLKISNGRCAAARALQFAQEPGQHGRFAEMNGRRPMPPGANALTQATDSVNQGDYPIDIAGFGATPDLLPVERSKRLGGRAGNRPNIQHGSPHI